ncbi:MAG: multicopper oxidase domain-containing protein [Deltaproteobacteria bacterium]|nr:multicopper oxidase domain-containing protein [Deltaproteobacteria bacterium]
MRKHLPRRLLARRSFLKGLGGTLALAAGTGLVPDFARRLLPSGVALAAPGDPPDLFFAGTDGWMSLPPGPPISYFHPDSYAPAPYTTYIFGFRNVTLLGDAQRADQKLKAQHTAPLFYLDEFDPSTPATDPLTRRRITDGFWLDLTNLGLGMRPDLTDAHTVHWHGFRNVITFFDGEPTGSVAVPVGRRFRYVYRPRDPGTYMFHCHVEDVEHVHMGMTGPVFVRAKQNFTGNGPSVPVARLGGNAAPGAPMGYAYNDLDGSTAYDREFAMMLTEVWAEAHWCDAHIQLPEWSDYRPDFALLNGRVHPDTLAPNGSIDPFHPVTDPGGDLLPPQPRAGEPAGAWDHLRYQPLSALVQCNAGERVLLRFANLGFREASMTLAGLRMRVVGKDATPMKGRDGTPTGYEAQTVNFGAGESIDAIFTAPPVTAPTTYLLFNRSLKRSANLAGGFGGQMTEVRVYPAGTVPPQTIPNEQFDL